MRTMLLACVRILKVCMHIQLGCICRPYVCVRTLKPRTLIQPFLLLFLYFICLKCLSSSLFSDVYVYVSQFICLFFLNMLD